MSCATKSGRFNLLRTAETQTAETQKRNRPEFESVVLDCPHPVVQRLQVAKEKYPNLSASYFSTFASVLIGFDAS
jgi:hypothetical protein